MSKSNLGVNDILDQLMNTTRESEKTAAATAASANNAAPTGMQAVLADAAANLRKIASTASATTHAPATGVQGTSQTTDLSDLQKLASDMADVDQASAMAQARLLGAASFDGMLARANEFAKVANAQQIAEAQYMANVDHQQKIAAYNAQQALRNQQINGAMHGFQSADVLMAMRDVQQQKTANDEATYLNDLSEGLTELGHTCKVSFENGYAHASQLLNSIIRR